MIELYSIEQIVKPLSLCPSTMLLRVTYVDVVSFLNGYDFGDHCLDLQHGLQDWMYEKFGLASRGESWELTALSAIEDYGKLDMGKAISYFDEDDKVVFLGEILKDYLFDRKILPQDHGYSLTASCRNQSMSLTEKESLLRAIRQEKGRSPEKITYTATSEFLRGVDSRCGIFDLNNGFAHWLLTQLGMKSSGSMWVQLSRSVLAKQMQIPFEWVAFQEDTLDLIDGLFNLLLEYLQDSTRIDVL